MRVLLDFVAEDSGGQARLAAVLRGGIAGLIVVQREWDEVTEGCVGILAAAEHLCPSGIRQLSLWPG